MKKDFLPKVIQWFRLDEHVRRLKTTQDSLETRVETLENSSGGGGVESISGDFVDNTDPANPVLDRGYKVYTALLNQTGTDAPVATVLENTLGSLIWSRNSAGNYQVASTSLFTAAKTFVIFGSTLDSVDERDVILFHQRESDSIISVRNRNIFFNTTDISDNLLVNLPIEIRVYN